MKNYLLCFFLLYSFAAFGQSDELQEAYEKYRNYYQKGEIDLAIRWAKKALTLEVEEFGAKDLGHATTLNNLATIYQNNQQYAKAIPLFEEAAIIFKAELGEWHKDYGTLLNNLAVLYENQQRYDEAKPLYRQVMRIRKKNLGQNDPKYREAVSNWATILYQLQQLEVASHAYRQLLTLYTTKNKGYAQDCMQFAQVYVGLDSIKKAAYYFEEAIQTEKEIGNGGTTTHALSLSKVANFYEKSGNYSLAAPLYEESTAILKHSVGIADTTYAASLLNLAGLYEELGQYVQTKPLYEEGISIYRQQFGIQHINYAQALSNQAGFFIALGKYSEAMPLYQQALTIYKSDELYQHEYATVLNNVAILYEKMGATQDAEDLYREILLIYQQGGNEEAPDYALVLNNLATLLKKKEQFEEAEQLYQQAIALKKRYLGTTHPEYAVSLNNLASLYKSQNRLQEAEPLYKQALAIKKTQLGETHPEYAISLNNLAALYEDMSDFEQSEPLYLNALRIIKSYLGEKHPSYATTLNNIAVLYESMGELPKSETYHIQANQNLRDQIQHYFPYLNENSRKHFWEQNLKTGFAAFYQFTIKRAKTNPAILGHAYDYRLATKAILLDGTAKMRKTILGSNNPILINQYNAWLTLKNQIAQAYTLSKSELAKKGWKLTALEQDASRLETLLSRQSQHFSHYARQQQVTWRDVQAKLQVNEAAIELIRVETTDPRYPIQYLAIIVKATNSASPEWVVLKNGQELETKFLAYYRNCMNYQVEDRLSYEQYWKPISEKLTGIDKVYFSSDGVFNQLNLSTFLNLTDHHYLGEETAIHLVTNTREITTWKKQENKTYSAYLIGHPSYQLSEVMTASSKQVTRGSSLIGNWFDKSTFEGLPGTENEITRIAEQLQSNNWQLTIKLHEQATEEELKQVSNPTVLHIATHGFFMPTTNSTSSNIATNPMLRSGLLLAGVEDYYGAAERPNAEDGILTAYEATTLFLDQTDLVILSACETGLGELSDGEGVYGLQRAFKVAGANTILMSLWKVDDEATQELMTNFYQNWLLLKDKRAAFKKAQRQLQQKYPSPYFWGAFIMVGE